MLALDQVLDRTRGTLPFANNRLRVPAQVPQHLYNFSDDHSGLSNCHDTGSRISNGYRPTRSGSTQARIRSIPDGRHKEDKLDSDNVTSLDSSLVLSPGYEVQPSLTRLDMASDAADIPSCQLTSRLSLAQSVRVQGRPDGTVLVKANAGYTMLYGPLWPGVTGRRVVLAYRTKSTAHPVRWLRSRRSEFETLLDSHLSCQQSVGIRTAFRAHLELVIYAKRAKKRYKYAHHSLSQESKLNSRFTIKPLFFLFKEQFHAKQLTPITSLTQHSNVPKRYETHDVLQYAPLRDASQTRH